MMKQYLNALISFFTILLLIPATIIAQGQNDSFIRSMNSDQLQWGQCPQFMPESCSIAVLQGDPTEPNTDLFFKMQGNTSVPNHWHHSAERMILVSGKMELKYKEQEPATISTGDYAYGPPEKPIRHPAFRMSHVFCSSRGISRWMLLVSNKNEFKRP